MSFSYNPIYNISAPLSLWVLILTHRGWSTPVCTCTSWLSHKCHYFVALIWRYVHINIISTQSVLYSVLPEIYTIGASHKMPTMQFFWAGLQWAMADGYHFVVSPHLGVHIIEGILLFCLDKMVYLLYLLDFYLEVKLVPCCCMFKWKDTSPICLIYNESYCFVLLREQLVACLIY